MSLEYPSRSVIQLPRRFHGPIARRPTLHQKKRNRLVFDPQPSFISSHDETQREFRLVGGWVADEESAGRINEFSTHCESSRHEVTSLIPEQRPKVAREFIADVVTRGIDQSQPDANDAHVFVAIPLT